MIRVSLFLTAAMILLFTLLLAAARAQVDDAELRAFLLAPEGCAEPCWQGIQPGITTVDEALALLQANRWVSRASSGGETANSRVYWQWSDDAPAFARIPVSAFPESYIYARNGVVRYIRLTTRIRYGEMHLVMGTPQTGSFQPSTPSAVNSLYFHTAGYFDGRVAFDSNVVCPAQPPEFWNDPLVITYSDGSYTTYNAMPPYHLIPWIYQTNCIT